MEDSEVKRQIRVDTRFSRAHATKSTAIGERYYCHHSVSLREQSDRTMGPYLHCTTLFGWIVLLEPIERAFRLPEKNQVNGTGVCPQHR